MLWEKDFDVIIEDSDYESKIRGLFRGKASQSIGIRITLQKCTYARTFDEIVIDLTDCWRREFYIFNSNDFTNGMFKIFR